MSEFRSVPLALDFGLFGELRLPHPMTQEQWENFEKHLPLVKAAFVKATVSAGLADPKVDEDPQEGP